MSKLSVVRACAIALATVLIAGEAFAESAPYPPSQTITNVSLDWSSPVRRASGSDNWPITWADDDHQYTSWGDGNGFNGTRVSLGVARIEGPWNAYQGHDVWGGSGAEHRAQFEGKSYGIVCVDGVLYMWVSPGSGSESVAEARLAVSTDHAASWTRASWAFPGSDGIIIPGILNFGKNYAGARDNYVYHYFIEKRGSGLGIHRPGAIQLARVPKTQLMTRNAYEFFAGFDGSGRPTWSSDVRNRRPVFQDPNGVGSMVSVSFNPGLGRYLLMTEHTSSSAGQLGIFDAPEPWGPWTTALYTSSFGGGQCFYYNFANKWFSADGRDFTLIYTGIGSQDAWQTVRGRFTVQGGGGGGGGDDHTAPSVPAGLEVTDATDTTIRLAWNASTDGEGSTPITYQVENVTEQEQSAWQTATSYTATGLLPGTSYAFRVRARDSIGNESAWSASMQGTTDADSNDPPNRPSSVVATALGSDAVRITWVDNGDPDGDPVQFYVEEVYDVRINSGWLAPGVTTWTATGLDPATEYRFQVRGRDDATPPAYSSWVRANPVTTGEDTGGDNHPPNDPTSALAAVLGSSSIRISWTHNGDPDGDAVQYYVREIEDLGINSGWLPAGATEWSATDLLPGTSYQFEIKGRDPFSPPYTLWVSTNVAITDSDTNHPPHRPTNVLATVLGSDAVRLTWVATGDPDGDPVQYYVEEVYHVAINSGWLAPGVVTWTATGLEPGTTYKFQVRGRDDATPPAYSAWVRANTVTTDDPVARPASPGEPIVTLIDGNVVVEWPRSEAADVVGYLVYRKDESGAIERLTASPITEPRFEDATASGGDHHYFVTAVGASARESAPSIEVRVEPAPEIPTHLFVEKAYPNPVRDEVTFRVGIPRSSASDAGARVTVDIYDVAGHHLGRVFEGSVPAGMREVSVRLSETGRRLLPGAYTAVIGASGRQLRQRIAVAGD